MLLFNNGLVCGPSWWAPLIPKLLELGIPLIFHHYRGHFEETTPSQVPLSLQHLASDVSCLIKQLDLQNVVLIGHSMGVNVSLKATLQSPEAIKALVMIAGSILPPSDFLFDSTFLKKPLDSIRKFSDKNPRVWNALWKALPYMPIGPLAVSLLGTNPAKTPLSRSWHFCKELGQMPPRVFWELLESLHDSPMTHELNKIDLPTLIIGGQKDVLCPPTTQEILAGKIHHSRYVQIKHAGHAPQSDCPLEVAQEIQLLLNQIGISKKVA